MLTFYSGYQLGHAPLRELNNGDWMDYAESPDRLTSMLNALENVQEPQDFGLDPLLNVHDADYVEFVSTAHSQWREAGRDGDAIGYTFPIRGRRALKHDRIDAKLGQYGFDAATPIAAGTWNAAYWGAQCALSATQAVASGEHRQSFALCRPPGHHSGRDYYGGYCYLNNAAIAARFAQKAGFDRVAILDVDYHHGNGTQDIFYEDGSVMFTSIHADPKTDYPYFWGHGDETGASAGKGTTYNQPLPRGTQWADYQAALRLALDQIASFKPGALIISYGADTFEHDPISRFALTTRDMQEMGAMIGTAALPTVTIMEGGYNIDALGSNVSAFLDGLEGV